MLKLAVILPCFNEEEVLVETADEIAGLVNKLVSNKKIHTNSEIYFIDDGSKDSTWETIVSLTRGNSLIRGIKLSRNMGHQNALLAGLFTVDADAIISIDADLQDDINIIEDMVDEYMNGNQIVYGVRRKRETDHFLKKWTALGFYKLMLIMGVDIKYNHADYRLLSRKAIDALKQFNEVNLFLRGMIPLIGFQSSIVYYDRLQRHAGQSKYSLYRMLSFAWNGITSFSIVPLRFITLLGFLTLIATMSMSAFIVAAKLFIGAVIPGWASTVLPIYFLGGIQIFSIGIIGEYVGKIYSETKSRPRYIIEKVI